MGLVQTISAGGSLYQARRDQISTYGSAAFGLMVMSYLAMSIFNCLANVLTPKYPCCCLIWSPEMEVEGALARFFFFFFFFIPCILAIEGVREADVCGRDPA